MTAQTLKITGLGTLECEIMKVLWQRPSATIRHLIESLGNRHAYTTIATVLKNLETKSLVQPVRDGRSVHYVSKIQRYHFVAEQMGTVLQGSENRAATLQVFVNKLSAEEQTALRQCLSEMNGMSSDEL